MKNGLMITPAGEFKVIDLSKTSELAVLQEAVEGWVQAIDLFENLTMWVNEEGKMIGLEHNPMAQYIWDMAFGKGSDHIVGTVVLTGAPDLDGETRGLQDEVVEAIQEFISIVVRISEKL